MNDVYGTHRASGEEGMFSLVWWSVYLRRFAGKSVATRRSVLFAQESKFVFRLSSL
jgi:hypothetical protein